MNPEAQEKLDEILKKNPGDLTSWERDFLKARQTYLNNEQKRVFAEILEESEPEIYVSRKEREAQEKLAQTAEKA